MSVYGPSYQPTQLIGLPPLSDETYMKLSEAMKVIYAGHALPRTREEEMDQK